MGGQRANVSRPFDLDWADLVPVSRPGGGIAVAHLRRYYETGFENKQMPKRLLARWQPESIPEFRASARQRFEEGLALAGLGHRTGAIYLWGYSAEMTLKAAYFGVIGLTETEVITWPSHIQPAINRGRHVLGIAWPAQGQGHNVRAWAELLVAGRAAIAGAAYVHPFGREVQACGQNIGQLWSEALRYHKNRAYLHELNQVREAAEWLLANARAL